MDNLTTEERIQLALVELYKQLTPNVSATANEFKVDRSTLSRRFRGVQASRTISRAEHCQRLQPEEEKRLIDFINKLTDRSMPPTSQIVKNVAEEIVGSPVGKNWVGQFVRQYKD